MPGDYDGDGKADFAVGRTGATANIPITWYILQTSNNQIRTAIFGATSDTPTQGDYDGDGRTDISVFRPAAAGSTFYVLNSLNNSFSAMPWGAQGDFPVNSFDSR